MAVANGRKIERRDLEKQQFCRNNQGKNTWQPTKSHHEIVADNVDRIWTVYYAMGIYYEDMSYRVRHLVVETEPRDDVHFGLWVRRGVGVVA